MESQSLTPKSYSTSHTQTRDKIINSIKDNLNYIYVLLMIVVNVLISLLEIQDGQIGINYPHSTLGWVLWGARMLLQTFIGVAILNSFRNQGIKLGHVAIKDTYEEYKKAMISNQAIKNPRSLHQYLSIHGAKDSLSKSIIYIISGVAVDSVLIGANLNNLLSLIVNILFAIAFGIKAMIEAEDYVVTELVMWYQLKIAEVTDHKLEPAKEDISCLTIKDLAVDLTAQVKSNSTDEKTLNKTND